MKSGVVGGLIGGASGFLAFAAGGVSGNSAGAILERMGCHAFVNMWMSGIQGNFDNMWSAALTGAASSLGGSAISSLNTENVALLTASNAIVGGTVSVIGGGKFANGAVTGAFTMLFNDLHGKIQQKSLEQQIEEKLKDVKVGESISGKELGQFLGNSKISDAVSKATRVNETTFKVDRTLAGLAVLKNSSMTITKTSILINNQTESVYEIKIDYKDFLIRKGCLPDFYINNNDVLYYNQNKRLIYGTTK
jgi:hypothetical protein